MENIIFENGEVFLLKKKYVENFLNECLDTIKESNNYEKEEIIYFEEEKEHILQEIKDFEDEEIVCLIECAMSGFFGVYQEEVQYYLDLKKEIEEGK